MVVHMRDKSTVDFNFKVFFNFLHLAQPPDFSMMFADFGLRISLRDLQGHISSQSHCRPCTAN